MFISPAYAQAAADGSSQLVSLAPLVLIFVVFYFFLIRPQQRKAKDLRTMLGALRRGDRVVTGGGIIGTIAKVVSEQEVMVDIAEGTRVRVLRSTISSVLAKTEPVAAKESAKGKAEEDETPAPAAANEEAPKDRSLGGAFRRMMGGKS